MCVWMTISRRFGLAALCLSLVLCAGCWNYQEISDVTFIAGAGVDADPAGGYILTLETVDFSGGDAGTTPKSSLITTSAPTIAQAVENAERSVSARLYWNHASTFVIGESLAEENIMPVLDFIMHNLDTAMNVWLLAAESGTAQSVFGLKTRGSAIVSYALRDIMQDNPHFGQTIPQRLFEALPGLKSSDRAVLTALVSQVNQNGEDTISVSGCAVMRGARRLSTLDGDQTAAALALQGRLSRRVLEINTGEEMAAVQLLGVERSLAASTQGERLRLEIRVDAGYAPIQIPVGGVGHTEKSLTARVEEAVHEELTEIINHAQTNLGCDIFGVGAYLQAHNPELWELYAGTWDAAFSGAEISVTVNARMVRDSTGPGTMEAAGS